MITSARFNSNPGVNDATRPGKPAISFGLLAVREFPHSALAGPAGGGQARFDPASTVTLLTPPDNSAGRIGFRPAASLRDPGLPDLSTLGGVQAGQDRGGKIPLQQRSDLGCRRTQAACKQLGPKSKCNAMRGALQAISGAAARPIDVQGNRRCVDPKLRDTDQQQVQDLPAPSTKILARRLGRRFSGCAALGQGDDASFRSWTCRLGPPPVGSLAAGENAELPFQADSPTPVAQALLPVRGGRQTGTLFELPGLSRPDGRLAGGAEETGASLNSPRVADQTSVRGAFSRVVTKGHPSNCGFYLPVHNNVIGETRP